MNRMNRNEKPITSGDAVDSKLKRIKIVIKLQGIRLVPLFTRMVKTHEEKLWLIIMC